MNFQYNLKVKNLVGSLLVQFFNHLNSSYYYEIIIRVIHSFLDIGTNIIMDLYYNLF